MKRHKYATLAAASAVVFLAIGVSVYQFSGAPRSDHNSDRAVIGPTTSEADLSISRIPSSGKILDIEISPDGKQVAYVLADGSTKKSIRLLELETSRETELVPARSDAGYEDLAFSPDGNHLYYVLFVGAKEDIYKIATRAGAPTKIIDGSVCGAGVSPDGKTLAFGREDDKSSILFTSNTDGLNQKVIAQSSPDGHDTFYCGGVPRWSPDGKEVACWADYTEKDEKFKKLVAISVADGSRRQLSDKRWADVDSAAYMPDGSLLVSAREKPAIEIGDRQLWLIARNSEPRRITTIPHEYSMLSATQKGDMVVARQSSARRDLWLLSNDEVGNARRITTSGEIWGGGSWMPDGRILYGSSITSTPEIWTMDNDGANRKRLTINQGANGWPAATRDGKYILFHSNRTENRVHVFRADADGANVKQLTNGFRETRPRPSPDGKWVYYFQWDEKAPASIRRISIDGGDPVVMVTAAEKTNLRDLDISKDGRIAYEFEQRVFDEKNAFLEWKRTIFIMSADGKPITSFDLPKTAQGGFIRWTPDGNAIAFHDVGDKSGDIWTIPVKGKPIAKRLTTFRTPVTFSFDWTIDGKQLLVTRATTTDDAVIIRRNN